MLHEADSAFLGDAGRRPPYPGGMPSFQEEQGGGDGALGSYSSSAFQAEQAGGRPLASYKSGGFQQEQAAGGGCAHWGVSLQSIDCMQPVPICGGNTRASMPLRAHARSLKVSAQAHQQASRRMQ